MGKLTAEKAWGVLVAAIAVYEFIAPEDHLLSNAVDRWLEKHPVLTSYAVLSTALHLLNVMPQRVDPFMVIGATRTHIPRVKLVWQWRYIRRL